MAFPPVHAHVKTIAVFITHVQYLVESCSATYFVGNFSSISLSFPKTLTALDQHVWPSVLLKHGTGFIINLVIDEKFLDGESHSLMLVKWQNTSPSHFLRNPTFGVISPTERLFSKPQTTGGKKDFLEFLVWPRWGWLDVIAISYPFPSLLSWYTGH